MFKVHDVQSLVRQMRAEAKAVLTNIDGPASDGCPPSVWFHEDQALTRAKPTEPRVDTVQSPLTAVTIST
jgi:hypothetical protein